MIPVMVVPVLNRYDLLQRMLDSIDFPVADLLLIDNGGDVDKLRFPNFVLNSHILPLPANLGVSGSWNLGVKLFPHAAKWIFASNDVVFGPGALERLCDARRDEITLTGVFPFWHVFSLGDEAVRTLGLFDECGFFPAYFEDNDMQRRADHHGVTVRKVDIDVSHDNSSTIKADPRLSQLNGRTFVRNQEHFEGKVASGDFGPGVWSLDRRRLNDWGT